MIPSAKDRGGSVFPLPPGKGVYSGEGFSLFEMLVVLMILAVMAAMATPAVGRLADNLKFRSQTREISSILRYARLQAISRGGELRVTLDEGEECIFKLSGAVRETRECGLEEDDVLIMEPEEILFFPEGTATPALITFEKGERVKKIRVDLLTAMPITVR
ncbi:MAG: GspH/FimT family pseudopilin [Proteobacteria bacterium]|nr:GspH/FimT family pseudopilin [Pseudomonadota bacterium]MBU1737289.1 GspH/FimT family pseudopilin [Pseudomonadota bacterium]